MACEDRGKDWSNTATSQGIPRPPSEVRREERKASSPEPSE